MQDSTKKRPIMRELSQEELATVGGGGRKWCCRNGKWYVCGSGKRPG